MQFQLCFTLGVNYTSPHSNEINGSTVEKDLSSEMGDRRVGSVVVRRTFLKSVQCVTAWNGRLALKAYESAKGNPAFTKL